MNESITYNTETEETDYHVNLDASVREFVGNSSDRDLGRWTLNFNLKEEFITLIWEKSLPFINRGVIFTSNEAGEVDCNWMDIVQPRFQDINIFVKLYDIRVKRSISDWSSNFDTTRLAAW